ncbi:mucin 5B, oligomeric mucus gel-forming [Pestalotiopsis sp. 9143b]|nr:mucin 5B, oligomeric mucus gel-forming [Pestalotiopsis sp. 9143b]
MSGKLAVLFAATGGAHALAARQAGCSFTAHTEGNVTYPLSQHPSGQSRAGSTMTPSVFTMNNTGLTDAQGRGCWWTPPTTVLQCDVGQIPETGFEIACDGQISFNGQTTFYECDTADGDQVNVYKLPGQAAANCGEITLWAEDCQQCSGDSSSVIQSYTASQPPAGSSGKTSAVNSATASYSASQPPAGSSGKTSILNSATASYSQPPVGSSTPGASYPVGTGSGSSPSGPAETPGTQITSTITSTSMITLTSCGPDVTNCPDVTVTEYAATETVQNCGDMECSLMSTPAESTPVVVQTTPAQSTPVAETTPAVKTSAQSVPSFSYGTGVSSSKVPSAATPSTTPVAETQSVPQYPSSNSETEYVHTSVTETVPCSESTGVASTPVVPVASQSTMSVPVYSTGKGSSSVQPSQSTVPVPVYSTGVSSQTVPVYSTGVSSIKSSQTVPVYSTSEVTSVKTSPSTVPVPESSTSQHGTTIDVDVTTTVPCETSSTAVTTPETPGVYSTTPVVPVESSQSTVSVPVYSTVPSGKSSQTAPVYSTTPVVPGESSQSTVSVPGYSTVPGASQSTPVVGQSTPVVGQSTIASTTHLQSTLQMTSTVTIPKGTTSVVSSVLSSQTVPVVESSTPGGTTIDVDVTSTVPCTTSSTSGAVTTTETTPVTTPETAAVYSTTPTEGGSTPSTSITGVEVPSPSTVNIPASCPGGVTNAGEFNLPHLIIVTDSESPDTANGTGYFGDITPTRSTIFNFDIEEKDAGKTCNLIFLFPEKDTLETSDFTFSGSGALDFSQLTTYATQETSYNNAPGVQSDLGQFTVSPGNAYDIASFECPAGSTIGIEMSDVSGGDTKLWFFQDYNPCPLGLFITTS